MRRTLKNVLTSYPWWLALFLIAYYVTNSVYQGYLSVYLSAKMGLDDGQIGVIFAFIAAVSVVTQLMWGRVGDSVPSRNALIRGLCVCACALIIVLKFVSGYWGAFIIAGLFAAFYMSIQPLGDSIILDDLNRKDQPFGPIRLAGGLSFAVFSMVYGKIVNGEGKEDYTIWFIAGLLICTMLSTFALPRTAGKRKSGSRVSVKLLLKNKEMMLLLLVVTLLQCTMGYFYTFFSIHFKSLEGADSALLGWCYFISACSEAPYLIFSDKLFKKLGVGKLFMFSALALTVRWITLALTNDYRIAMLSQCCHGFGFIVLTVGMSKYISLTVPDELKATGQMLVAVASFGIARVVGNLAGGILSNDLGTQKVFFVSAAISALTFICFAPYYFRKKAINGQK